MIPHDETTQKSDRLRRLLRQADPAARTPGLPAADARGIRRRMLDEAERAERRWLAGWLFRPAWAAAAAALVLVVVLVLVWRSGEAPAPSTPEPPVQTVATPREPSSPETPTPATEPEDSPREPRAPEPRLARAEPAGASSSETASNQRSRRQVQMEAPGGTRIVWVLDPDSTL